MTDTPALDARKRLVLLGLAALAVCLLWRLGCLGSRAARSTGQPPRPDDDEEDDP